MKKWPDEPSRMIYLKYKEIAYDFKLNELPSVSILWYKISKPLDSWGLCLKKRENNEVKWKASWYYKTGKLITAKTCTIDVKDIDNNELITRLQIKIKDDLNVYMMKINQQLKEQITKTDEQKMFLEDKKFFLDDKKMFLDEKSENEFELLKK